MAAQPLLSVGVPVRNGAAWIERTLRDLLEQTLGDLEVVVSDNASTDETPTVVQDLAASDPRLRWSPVEVDRGPAANYDRVFALSTGRTFAWSAADDRHRPQWAQRCLDALDARPGAALAQSETLVVDEDEQLRLPGGEERVLDHADASRRLAAHLGVDRKRSIGFDLFGVVPRDVMARVLPHGSYASADRVLLTRLLLQGPFIRVDEPLFLNRDHSGRSMRTQPPRGHQGRSSAARVLGHGPAPGDAWWNPHRPGALTYPEWNEVREHLRAVDAAGLAPEERRRCRRVVLGFALRNAHKLSRDVAIGAEHVVRRGLSPARPADVA